MYTQHFIVEGKYLGQAVRGAVFVHADLAPPLSYAFACPVCAEVWARCPVELPDGSHRRFQFQSKACRKHFGHALEVPGALTLGWDASFTDAFPEGVLRWELQRHLDLYPATA